jgi:hypothetical protein
MITLDHHIVPSRERDAAASWFIKTLGLAEPRTEGPFAAVDLGGNTSLFFAGWDDEIVPQHYAFAVSDADFGAIVDRLRDADVDFWADHNLTELASVRRDATGSGVYFRSSEGHLLELISYA